VKSFIIVIERAGDNYSAYAPEVPGCVATGSTEKEAEANMQTALEMHLRGMEEDGMPLDTDAVTVRRGRVGSS